MAAKMAEHPCSQVSLWIKYCELQISAYVDAGALETYFCAKVVRLMGGITKFVRNARNSLGYGAG